MAEYIKTLKEDNGDITYPVTQAGAVLLSGGGDLETALSAKASQTSVDGKIAIGDVQSTDIVANAVTTAKIADEAVTTAKIANGTITSGDINWSDFGGTWSTFYFPTTAGESTVTRTTKKGTVLTLQVAAGGTAVRILAGGNNVFCVRQYWGARYTANNTANWRVSGLKSGSSVYTTFYGARNAGSNINVGGNATTASTGTDGMCVADLASLTGGKVASSAEFVATKVDETSNVWEIIGTVSGKGTSTNMSFSAECTSAAGFVPTIYQASASIAWSWNILEVFEP